MYNSSRLMVKSVLWFLIVVIVSARCSAESIPAISNTSGFANHTQSDEQKIQANDEAPHEEREIFAIDSFVASVKKADETLPGTIHAENMVGVPQMKQSTKALAVPEANMMDVSDIKERNKVLATRLETLGIDIGVVVSVAKALTSDHERFFSLNNLEWMILGKIYFEKINFPKTNYRKLIFTKLFDELNVEITNYEEIRKWSKKFRNFNVRGKNVFGKMLWLLEHDKNKLNLDLGDAAKMAFGSEYLERRKLPSPEEIITAVADPTVDREFVESVLRTGKGSRKQKLQNGRGPFAIESITSSVKTADESLRRIKPGASMMDISEIKARNKVLFTRMETLGIDIDGVVFVSNALGSSKFESYFSQNNLGWMLLGKLYFEKIKFSTTGYRTLIAEKLFEELNMEIVDNVEFRKWTARLNNFSVGAKKVFGKMLWLLQHQNDLKLDFANAAKMAFGSEYLETRELPFSELVKAVTEHHVDKESLIRQDKDSTMTAIAREKLLESIRNYLDDEVLEPPNQKKKISVTF